MFCCVPAAVGKRAIRLAAAEKFAALLVLPGTKSSAASVVVPPRPKAGELIADALSKVTCSSAALGAPWAATVMLNVSSSLAEASETMIVAGYTPGPWTDVGVHVKT